jgi:hypothetical protein
MPSLTIAFHYNKIQPKVKRFVDFFVSPQLLVDNHPCHASCSG